LGFIVNNFRSDYEGSYEIEHKERLKVMNYSNIKRFIKFLNTEDYIDENPNPKKVHTFLTGGDFNCVKSIDYVEHTGNEAEYSYVSFVLSCGPKLT
jgi:hypothetical protein